MQDEEEKYCLVHNLRSVELPDIQILDAIFLLLVYCTKSCVFKLYNFSCYNKMHDAGKTA